MRKPRARMRRHLSPLQSPTDWSATPGVGVPSPSPRPSKQRSVRPPGVPWAGFPGPVQTVRDVCRQDSQGRETCRPPRAAADQVRTGYQSQGRQGAGADDPAVCSPAGGPDHPMMNRRTFLCGLTLVTLPTELAEGRTADAPTSTRRTAWERAPWHATQRLIRLPPSRCAYSAGNRKTAGGGLGTVRTRSAAVPLAE